MSFVAGVKLRLSAGFLNALDAYYDPSTVVARVKKPDGTLVSPNPTVTQDSVGHYHANVIPDQAGVWRFRWEAATDVADEGQFVVRPSDF